MFCQFKPTIFISLKHGDALVRNQDTTSNNVPPLSDLKEKVTKIGE